VLSPPRYSPDQSTIHTNSVKSEPQLITIPPQNSSQTKEKTPQGCSLFSDCRFTKEALPTLGSHVSNEISMDFGGTHLAESFCSGKFGEEGVSPSLFFILDYHRCYTVSVFWSQRGVSKINFGFPQGAFCRKKTPKNTKKKVSRKRYGFSLFIFLSAPIKHFSSTESVR